MSVPADPRLLVLGAVGLQAAVHGTMSGRVSPGESLLFDTVAFGLCAIVFLVVRRIRGVRRLSGRERVLLAGMNVLSAVTFIGFYASLTLIPASTTASLETAAGPIVVAMTRFRSGMTGTAWAFAGALAGLATVLAIRSWDAGTASGVTAAGGVLLAVAAGCGMAGIAVLSRRLGDLGVGAVTVTAHRFHLTYALAAVLWLATGDGAVPDAGRVGVLAGYGVVTVILPLFLLQAGLQRADPLTAMVIVATAPSITYLVQVAAGTPYDPLTFTLIVAVIVLAALYNSGAVTPRVVRAGAG